MMLSKDQIAALPYRPCAGAMVISADRLVFAGRRLDSTAEAWQMPQGGIDEGEAPLAAALREVGEETGIIAHRLELLRECSGWIDYDLPGELMGRLWKGRYRGQSQKWFAFRFQGADADIDISTGEPEFSAWRWMRGADLMKTVVPFKTHVYRRVLAEFGDLLA